MGKTSSAVKDRYNKKTYDAIIIRVKKGTKERWKAEADKRGESLNLFIANAVENVARDSE